jgi:hypothetical protein
MMRESPEYTGRRPSLSSTGLRGSSSAYLQQPVFGLSSSFPSHPPQQPVLSERKSNERSMTDTLPREESEREREPYLPSTRKSHLGMTGLSSADLRRSREEIELEVPLPPWDKSSFVQHHSQSLSHQQERTTSPSSRYHHSEKNKFVSSISTPLSRSSFRDTNGR